MDKEKTEKVKENSKKVAASAGRITLRVLLVWIFVWLLEQM